MIRISLIFLSLLFMVACVPGADEDAVMTCPDTILIKDFSFSPANCKVKVGSSLTFKNVDTVPHTATALFDAPVKFDTGDLVQDASAIISFDTAAIIPFHCAIHPSMMGSIVVEP